MYECKFNEIYREVDAENCLSVKKKSFEIITVMLHTSLQSCVTNIDSSSNGFD